MEINVEVARGSPLPGVKVIMVIALLKDNHVLYILIRLTTKLSFSLFFVFPFPTFLLLVLLYAFSLTSLQTFSAATTVQRIDEDAKGNNRHS